MFRIGKTGNGEWEGVSSQEGEAGAGEERRQHPPFTKFTKPPAWPPAWGDIQQSRVGDSRPAS